MRKMHFPSRTELEQQNDIIIDSYDYLANAASTTDCTGLIPSEPVSDAELESYSELYKYHAPVLDQRAQSEPPNLS